MRGKRMIFRAVRQVFLEDDDLWRDFKNGEKSKIVKCLMRRGNKKIRRQNKNILSHEE